MHSVNAFLSVYFVYAFIPETCGMTLEAIESKMEQTCKDDEKETLLTLEATMDETDGDSGERANYGTLTA